MTVIAVDTSYSVSAPQQVAHARALARRAIDEARADRAVALIAFDDRASVLVTPTLDRGIVQAAVDRITPGLRATRYGAATTAAVGLMAGRGGRLVVVSDLQQGGWRGRQRHRVPPGIEVDALDVGGPPGNIAVTSVRRNQVGIVATIRNGGPAPRSTRVALAIDGRTRAEQTVPVPAGAATEVPFTLPLPAAGAARVDVADPDGYAADNVRFAILVVAATENRCGHEPRRLARR